MPSEQLLEAVLSLASSRGHRRITVVGPTASGKSTLALALADTLKCAILSADARQVYRGMDIGTAKPTPAERARVHHELIDVADPPDRFTLADYLRLARPILASAEAADAPLVIAGGTGLYIDALLDTFELPRESVPAAVADRLATLSLADLLTELDALDLVEGQRVDRRNRRRVERALAHLLVTGQSLGASAQRMGPRPGMTVVGIDVPAGVLHTRIAARVEAMLEQGLLSEVRALVEQYGPLAPGLDAIGYKEFLPVLEGTLAIEAARAAVVTHTRQYAKRQRTWFRHRTDVQWYALLDTDGT